MMNGAAYSQEALALRSRHAQQLRDEWQCRLLVETKDTERLVVLAVLANLYYDHGAFEILMRVAFPDFIQIKPPIYSGFATIKRTGHVVCDYIDSDHTIYRNVVVYDSEERMVTKFRRLADSLKLSDADRTAMFRDLKKWVSRDERIGPSVEHKHEADA